MKKERLQGFWRDSILEHIPHGEDGSLQCNEEETHILTKLLVKKGYAVCITGGDIGDDVRVSWIYAGDVGNLDWADYDQIIFSHIDYLEDYPQALQEDIEDQVSYPDADDVLDEEQ